MKISFFKKLPEKNKPHICDEVISIQDFLKGVKYGKWKDRTDPVRKEKVKKKRDWLKKSIPSITISGVFKERKEDLLIQHSGFICIDIDDFKDKTELIEDRYTYALFHSASGNGIAVIVKINPEKHKESYDWLSNHYYVNYGISVDPAPKNPASLRFVSYDPDLYVNDKSLKAKTKSRKPKKPQTLPVVMTGNEVDEMVNEAYHRGINIAPDYDSYLKLGFAIANGFGEGGRRYFHLLCSPSEKYNEKQTDKQYNWCLRGAEKRGITVGTFYHMLKEHGIKFPKKNDKGVQIAAMAKKSGRTKEGAAKHLTSLEGYDEETANQIAEQVFERDDIDLASVSGDPEQLIPSLVEWLRHNHPVKVNSITRMLEENGTEVKKERLNTIYLRARMAFNSKEVTKDLVETVLFSDMIHEFNPIENYINENRHRKSTGNVDAIIQSIYTDTYYAKYFIRYWLRSIIAAHDGNPVRGVLALTGGQNTGKTEWFRRLLPAKIKKYYAESKLDAGKDDEILMCQKLVLMDDEMGGKSRNDEKRFKELTSKHTFSLRAPYARHNEDFKRLAVLCGTSNDSQVINDPTGNTRIMPINVISINHEVYNSVDKDELFMELVREYESGLQWQADNDELLHLKDISEDFEVIPFERELIQKFFKKADKGGGIIDKLTSTEIKDYIETYSKQKITNIRRFGTELVNIFGKAEIQRIDGQVKKCYSLIKRRKSDKDEESDLPF